MTASLPITYSSLVIFSHIWHLPRGAVIIRPTLGKCLIHLFLNLLEELVWSGIQNAAGWWPLCWASVRYEYTLFWIHNTWQAFRRVGKSCILLDVQSWFDFLGKVGLIRNLGNTAQNAGWWPLRWASVRNCESFDEVAQYHDDHDALEELILEECFNELAQYCDDHDAHWRNYYKKKAWMHITMIVTTHQIDLFCWKVVTAKMFSSYNIIMSFHQYLLFSFGFIYWWHHKDFSPISCIFFWHHLLVTS